MASLLQTQRTYRARLLAADRATARELVRIYADLSRAIMEELTALTEQIRLAQAAGETVNQSWLFQQQRYRNLLQQADSAYRQASATASGVVSNTQAAATQLGTEAAEALVRSLAPPQIALSWSRLPIGAIESFVGFASDGSPLSSLFDALGPQGSAAIRSSLLRGIGLGYNPRKIARMVRDSTGISLTRALTISRTEVLRAYRQAETDSYRANSDVVKAKVWHAELTERTCPVCVSQHGAVYPLEATMDTHPSCFPAGTLVAGPPSVGATARRFDGEVVVIRFASGDELTATPNHPVLTPRGWVAAGLLNEGGDVVRSRGAQRPLAGVYPHDDERPAVIEQVSESLLRSGQVMTARVPASPEYFHGDGSGGDIDVVRADGSLKDRIHASLIEPLRQQLFGGLDADTHPFARLGSTDLLIEGMLTATDSLMGGHSVGAALLGRSGGGHDSVSRSRVAELHAILGQPHSDRGSGDSERLGDAVLGFAGLVATHDVFGGQISASRYGVFSGDDAVAIGLAAPQSTLLQDGTDSVWASPPPSRHSLTAFAGDVFTDRILDVSRRRWSGDVYNLETVDGWYIANDTIVHNCRCSWTPQTVTWAELGYNVPDTNPQIEAGADWFAAQPSERQAAILGPGRLAAYQSGKLTLPDMVGRRVSRRWGPTRYVLPLRDALEKAQAA